MTARKDYSVSTEAPDRTTPPGSGIDLDRQTDTQAVVESLLCKMRSAADADNVAGMARFGINPTGTLGVSMVVLRDLARTVKRELGKDAEARHGVAEQLWASEVHEARILAALVDVPQLVDAEQMERWAAQIDSWDICDQLCGKLFDKAGPAWEKAAEWTSREEQWVKRAGFVLITQLAVHDKTADDERFLGFFELIEREAADERNFVKKAVNWALRQLGKRSAVLHPLAIDCGERILERYPDSSAARWVARDALRELRSDAVLERLGLRA